MKSSTELSVHHTSLAFKTFGECRAFYTLKIKPGSLCARLLLGDITAFRKVGLY